MQAGLTGLANLSMPGILAGRSPEDEQIDDSSLLGWRTRLIQHVAHRAPSGRGGNGHKGMGGAVYAAGVGNDMGPGEAVQVEEVTSVEGWDSLESNVAGLQGLPFGTQEESSTGDLVSARSWARWGEADGSCNSSGMRCSSQVRGRRLLILL